MTLEDKMELAAHCQMNGCAEMRPGQCRGCGFQREEAERRAALPWKQNEKGLWRKDIGKGGR